MLDVLLEYPIHVATGRVSRSIPRSRGSACARRHRAALPAGRRRRARVRVSSATRASCGSIRAGIRRRCGSSQLGFQHILDGIDHLLFLFCLVIPFRRLRPLVAIVTAFTVAHSITLIASACELAPDALWFPPLIETLIAAVDRLHGAREHRRRAELERRWMIAFGFGLVHGFGFSFALREIAAVRRLASADVAAVVQRRRRARSAARARAARAGARICCSGTSSPSGWGRSSCRRSSRTRRGTGWRSDGSAAAVRLAGDPGSLAAGVRWMMAALVIAVLLWIVAVAAAKRKKDAAVN